MKPAKKIFSFLGGKIKLNWPNSPALPQRPKFKFYFPAKESKDFFAGFIEKLVISEHRFISIVCCPEKPALQIFGIVTFSILHSFLV